MTLPRAAVGRREPSSRRYAEVFALLGPEVIGATGDNAYRTLYGRPYALVLTHAPRRARLYRGQVGGGGYEEVTAGLPSSVFGPTVAASERRLTAAFDQSARIIVASERDGMVRVTRWDGSAYVQNVTFAGVDPALLMDATVTDPRGYPNLLDDGWSVREAFDAGIPVLFEWLVGDPVAFLETAIPDSDVLLFYLSPDRLELRVRVQRQIYATPRTLWTFAEPVILDRVVAIRGRYQALVSDASGEPLPEMIVSDPYLGDFIINPRPVLKISLAMRATEARVEVDVVEAPEAEQIEPAIGTPAAEVVSDTALRSASAELSPAVDYASADVVSDVRVEAEGAELAPALATGDPADVVVVIIPQEEDHALTPAIEVGSAIVREV